MKWLICFLIGHKSSQVLYNDGKGAAWYRCPRCKTVTASHTYHGGKPWLEGGE